MKMSKKNIRQMLEVLMNARQNAYEMGYMDEVAEIDKTTEMVKSLYK